MVRFVMFVLLLSGLVACQGRQERHAHLETISALLADYPDSALRLVESLPDRSYRSPRLRADRALIYAIALDKNYIDSDNDSLLRHPYHYYRDHRTTDSVRHLVHYYQGRIYQNGDRYTEATAEYLEALRLLDTLAAPYRAGLLFTRLGEMYREQYNFESALGYFHRAHAAFERANRISAVSYAMASIGRVLRSLHRHNDAESWYMHSLAIDNELGNTKSALITLSNLLVLYYESNNKEKFKDLYNYLISNDRSALLAVDHLVIADFLIEEKHLEQAKAHLVTADSLSYAGNEPLYYLMQFKLASAEHDYERANRYQYLCINSNDSIVRNVYSTSVAKAEQQYYAEQSAFAAYRLRASRYLECAALLFFLILIGCLIWYYRRHLRRKERELFNYMVTVDQMQEQYSQMQCVVATMDVRGDSYKPLLAEHFSILDSLCRTFFERNTPRQQQEQLFREVQTRLQALADDPQMASELDRVINARYDQLMVRLVEQLPQLSADDIHFLRLVYAGFSAQVISLVYRETVQNIYARKYRIKKRIQNSKASDKKDFVDALY